MGTHASAPHPFVLSLSKDASLWIPAFAGMTLCAGFI